ncbi:MAG TPA: peptidylprolyl isomerase, partial [Methylophilaceae bacterium]|nr:peptidylprolyl isomerase [Methylophilaceae bacterium]
AMARGFNPDSATSQFFINLSDNKFLNFYKPDPHYMGYCVFGKVIRGLGVVEQIGKTSTQPIGKHLNVPLSEVVIQKVTMLEVPVTPETRVLPASLDTPSTPKAKSAIKGKKRG